MTVFRNIVVGVCLVLIIGVIGIVGVYMHAAATVATAPARVVTSVMQTNNIISNYEWFTDQYNKIKQAALQIKTDKGSFDGFVASLPKDRSQWQYEDSQEWSRQNSILTGARNFYTGLINDYNSKAAMLDRSIFMDRSLPQHIDVDTSLL